MWLLRIIGIIVVLVVIVVVGLLLLPGERIAAIAADQVRAQTGRELRIEGGVKVTLWPVLGVRTGPVSFGNADWAGPDPMLTADSLAIGLSAPDLLRGEIRVKEIVADRPDLRLQRGKDGRGNWEIAAAASGGRDAPGAGDGGSVPLTLEILRLTDARLSYRAPDAAPVEVVVDRFELRWPDPAAPVDLQAAFRPFGDTVEVEARIERPRDLADGAAVPVTARAVLPGGSVAFDGRANMTGEAAGRVTLDAGDSPRMLAALGQPGVTIPSGLGRIARMTTEATYTADGRLSLRDLAMQLDQNRISGAADLAFTEPLQVTARLSAGVLDLAGLGGGSGGAASGGENAAQGWSRDPIDASALALLNGSLRLTADRVDTGTLTVTGLDGSVQIDRSRAVLTLQPLTVFGGSVQGELVANNRSGLSVGGRLAAGGIEMEQMLGTLAGVHRLSGKAAADLEFLGSGPSVDAIMRSLSGGGSLRMGQGVIAGIDLDQMLRSGIPTGGTTVFDSLTASHVIRNGDLLNEDLVLKLSRISAEGKGRVGLGARDIDYLFTPVRLKDDSGREIAISARIVGPWANPRIKPELNEALQAEIDAKIEAKKDELEQKAKDTVTEKLAEELDVTVQDDQSVEDALKSKLEEEAAKGLLKLFGSN